MRAALATADDRTITHHFGHSPFFRIVDIDESTETWAFSERRENDAACWQGGEHDTEAFARSIDNIADCGVVFVLRIGTPGRMELERRGIQVLETGGAVETLIEKYIIYLKKEKEKKRAKRFRALAQTHPCLSCGSAPNNKGRVHLPVSAACNIQCRFCQRACNACDDRPGVANGILQAEEADAIVEKALALCPELTVVGVAGPGDSLASPHALEAFRRVHAKYPELIMCMSTNGLALPGKIPELQAVGVKTITVTVNAVDPVILEKIVSHIVYGGRLLCGAEAGEILIRNQLRGIREASDAGIIVKVNTVLIPGVNDEHIASIAREIADAGAMLHNILPLIPQHELRDIPAPTCQQINDARAKAGEYIQQFLHCKHCRADACGIPGQSDLSSQLYDGKAMETFSHG